MYTFKSVSPYCLFKSRHGERTISLCLSNSFMVLKKQVEINYGNIDSMKYGLFNCILNQIIVSHTLDLEYMTAILYWYCTKLFLSYFLFLINPLITFPGVLDRAVAGRGCEPLAPNGHQRRSECWALQCLHRGRSAVCYQQNPGGGLPHRPHPGSSYIRSQDSPAFVCLLFHFVGFVDILTMMYTVSRLIFCLCTCRLD